MQNIIPYGKAICYSGYRRGQCPKGEAPSYEQIKEDLLLLSRESFRYLRMYDPNLHARRVLQAIRELHLDMKCIIGIDSDPEVNNPQCPFEVQRYSEQELEAHKERNDRELQELIRLARDFPDEILALSVGNENTPPWGAHMVSQERLLQKVALLKESLTVPVTFCEGVMEWPALPRLAQAVDFISVHSYPYHYGTPLSQAVAQNREHYQSICRLYPDRQVIFTELGWSSCASSEPYLARAGLAEEKQYIESVQDWLEKDRITGFLFEAFDEPWKGRSPEDSECNFGLYTVDRVRKW